MKNLTFVKRMVLVTGLAAAGVGILLAITCGIFIDKRTTNDYQLIARTASVHISSMLKEINDDDYWYDEATGQLYKGDYLITDAAFADINVDNNDVYHTIFWGKTRVLSNLTNEKGESIVGTQLTDTSIVDAVQKDGFYTASRIKIYGSTFTVCYYPIRNGNEIVGYVFTGVNQSAITGFIRDNTLICVAITIVLVLIISVIITRVIKKWAMEFGIHLGEVSTIASGKEASVSDMGESTLDTMQQINLAIDQVSGAVTAQASYTDEIMSSMEEFGNSIDVIIDHVQATSDIANESITSISELKDQLAALEQVSAENSTSIEDISAQIEEDNRAVGDINKILDVINNISFQITILSFNASVEAARAGEYGRGFEVVADSIKNLSDQTQESLDNITEIVGGITKKMGMTNQASIELIGKNNQVAEELAATKEKLDSVIESYNTIVNNISDVINESDAIICSKNQVVETVSSLAATSEENAAMSEQMKASSDEVLEITQNLLNEIKTLREINGIVDDVKGLFSDEI